MNRIRLHQGLAFRIVSVSLALLLLVQAAGFSLVRESIQRNARAQLASELQTDERVWRRLIDQHAERLRQGAGLLAADFGFRAAVSSGDVDTVRSALDNQGQRIGATITALFDPQRQLKAVGESLDMAALAPRLTQLASLTERSGQGDLLLVDARPYQFVMVPVKAPVVIGWVLMGFPIDQNLVNDMRALLPVHVAVLAARAGDAEYRAVVTSLPQEALAPILPVADGVPEFEVSGQTLVTRRIDSAQPEGRIRTVLLRSVDEVVKPYEQLQFLLAIITLLGVVLVAIGSSLSALRVTTPLRALMRATERLGDGDYATPMEHTRRRDEIGSLARAFDAMRINIATQQSEIRQLAYWDRLTGLPNRAQFREQAITLLAEATRTGGSMAVIALNLDRFKHVNDLLGYATGDRLLCAVAQRLQTYTRATGDMVARMGGDEFALLIPTADSETAQALARRIQQGFEVPVSFDDQMVDISAAMGVAIGPLHAQQADDLLSSAEIAMHVAKRKTTGVQLYEEAIDSASSLTLSLLSEMRQAIAGNEFRLYLQPKVRLADNQVVAAEALVRWQHPQRGLVPPMQFVPFAEQTGFVRQLTVWMLEEAAKLLASLPAGPVPLRIAVNLSTRDLLDVEFPDYLADLLARHGLASSALCLEITESAIMDDPERAQNTLRRLSAQGFKLSIDDFGTGYSSLAYLKQLPVSELKIDKSFVMGMEKDESDAKIVRSTIDLAHNLGLRVVAEGVENALIMERLRELECDEAQGYFMSKPVPAPEMLAWRERWHAEYPPRGSA